MPTTPDGGGDVDDAAVVLLDHLLELVLHADEDAAEVDGEEAVEGLEGHVGGGVALGAKGDGGAVDGGVKAAERGDGLRDGVGDLVGVGDVDMEGEAGAAGVFDELAGRSRLRCR